MKIVVLNGSPKGDLSVTLQYIHYLEKVLPGHDFKIHNVAQRIQAIEKDQNNFDEIIADIQSADGVIWSFPLYFLLVHGHYKRFIELVFERGAAQAFAGKYAAAISTSIHYFDHTAHAYIQSICADLGMHFVESYSAHMSDLLKEPERRHLVNFGRNFFEAIETRAVFQPIYAPVVWHPKTYQPGPGTTPLDPHEKKIAIIYDGEPNQANLNAMVSRARACFSGQVTLVNLREVNIKSGCLGCLRCGFDNECFFEGKDGYIDFFRQTILPADVLIFAGAIHDRYLSSRWKIFFDRSFFNTHTPVLTGKQLAFLVSGPLGQIPNLREIMQGYAEFQGANVVGFTSDEGTDSSAIDAAIDRLMALSLRNAQEKYARPQSFLGLGGMKVFRDDVYGPLRAVFQADHRAYRRNGLYKTFPQRDWRTRLMNAFAVPILNIPSIKRGFKKQMTRQMVVPLQKVVEGAKPR